MVKLITLTIIGSLYFSCLYIYICHRHYFNSLFKKTRRFKQDSSSLTGHRSIHTRVAPMYREEYFGYNYFVLPDIDNTILTLDRYFRVYGVVHPFTECIVVYKDDVVKTIICLEDKRYGDKVLESLRITYRNTIIVITGGVVLWRVGLLFSIF